MLCIHDIRLQLTAINVQLCVHALLIYLWATFSIDAEDQIQVKVLGYEQLLWVRDWEHS
jgi:hypothetical protein